MARPNDINSEAIGQLVEEIHRRGSYLGGEEIVGLIRTLIPNFRQSANGQLANAQHANAQSANTHSANK